MMLRKSTEAEKYFRFPNRCYGYEDRPIHVGKKKIGVISLCYAHECSVL